MWRNRLLRQRGVPMMAQTCDVALMHSGSLKYLETRPVGFVSLLYSRGVQYERRVLTNARGMTYKKLEKEGD